MEYKLKIVCFLDILAFKNIINNTLDKDQNDKPEKIKEIHDVLHLAREILDIGKQDEMARSKMVTQFSDSIVISFDVQEESQIFFTLNGLMHLIMNFAYRGILVRGGISYGKLIHTKEIVFGPGLITAYETESRAALYPRVILDKSIIDIAKLFPFHPGHSDYEEEAILNIVTKDTDDMYYIDYIKKAQSELDDPQGGMPDYINHLIKIAETNKTFQAPDIKVKNGWLINKINELIKHSKNEKFLDALKLNGDSDIAEFYENLEFI